MLRALFLLLYFATDQETLTELMNCGWNSALSNVVIAAVAGAFVTARRLNRILKG